MRVLATEVTGNRILGSLLDSLASPIVILDQGARVVMVNEAFLRFGRDNGWPHAEEALGRNYMQECVGHDGQRAARAIQQVLMGSTDRARTTYTCHSPTEQRWFQMTVTPWQAGNSHGALIIHDNCTESVVARMAIDAFLRRMLPEPSPLTPVDLQPFLAALADELDIHESIQLAIDDAGAIPLVTATPTLLYAVAALAIASTDGMRVYSVRGEGETLIHCLAAWSSRRPMFWALRNILEVASASLEETDNGAIIHVPSGRHV